MNINSVEKIFGEHKVRMLYDKNNNVWFVGKDICKILDYKNERRTISDFVDEEDKLYFKDFVRKSTESVLFLSIHPDIILINESGFYCLAIKSRKEIAKNFRRWVTSEVLPSIRETGQYNIEQSQKAIELKLQEKKLKEIELSNRTLELENDNKRLCLKEQENHLKENGQKIEALKLTLIDNNKSIDDDHYNILARERIQGHNGTPEYFEISQCLTDLKNELNLTHKEIVNMRGSIGKMIKKWYKENKSGGQSPATFNKYVNDQDRKVYFYPIDIKPEIIYEIKKYMSKTTNTNTNIKPKNKIKMK